METFQNNLLSLSNCLNLEFRNFFFGTSNGNFVTKYPHNRLLFSFGSRGDTAIEDGSATVKFKRGMWLLIPAFQEARHFHAGSNHLSIHFSFSVLRGVEILANKHRIFHGEDPALTQVAESLVDSPGSLHFINGVQLLCRQVLFEVLREEVIDMEQVYSKFVKYARLTEYLHRNCDFHVSVADMAKIMNMGEQNFAKKFSADTGIAPRKFFDRILADHAVKLLTGTESSIKEIAEAMGFCSEYYFSRFFKRHLGLPPSEFRQRHTRFDLNGKPSA